MIIKIAQLLLSLTILVALHELGHFVAAKMFKTRVEKFYIFLTLGFLCLKENWRNYLWNRLVAAWWIRKDFWND